MRNFSLIFVCVTLFLFAPLSLYAQVTAADLSQQITELQERVLLLQSKVKALQQQGPDVQKFALFSFDINLFVGNSGEIVTQLQEALTDNGVYSGPVTGYFGPLTKGGVVAFQEKYAADILAPLGLTRGTGYFGPSTRKKLNILNTLIDVNALATDTEVTFLFNEEVHEVLTKQGSPMTLIWNVKNTNLTDLTPCVAAVDGVDNSGALFALTDYYYSWIGPQAAVGSAEVLAYAVSGDPLERIFKLMCTTTEGQKTSVVSVKVFATDPDEPKDRMIITMLANKIAGASVAKTSIANIQKLNLSWSAVGDASPAVCTLSDIGNVIIAKNLLSSDSYTIANPQIGQRYYINCTDADGEYAFDGVELVE